MSSIIEKNIKAGTRKMKIMVEKYNSAMEVANDCRKRQITDSCFDDKSKETFGSWEGVKSYDKALELLSNGYQPTVEKMKEKMKDLGNIGLKKRITFENDVAGGIAIVPLSLINVPKSMIDTKIKPIKCKVIDVYYDITCSSNVDSEDIIKNGQKLLGAILELEKLGYKFNLYAVQTYSDENSADVLAVKIKSSNQPLDLKRISFPLTHTAFFRIIGFDWYSRCPKAKYRGGYGRGIAYRLNSKELNEFARQVFGDNALMFAGKNIMCENEKAIKEAMENFGKRKI